MGCARSSVIISIDTTCFWFLVRYESKSLPSKANRRSNLCCLEKGGAIQLLRQREQDHYCYWCSVFYTSCYKADDTHGRMETQISDQNLSCFRIKSATAKQVPKRKQERWTVHGKSQWKDGWSRLLLAASGNKDGLVFLSHTVTESGRLPREGT